jgi:anti-sigma factor RsiW
MAGSTDKSEPRARELADLSALADGTLDPARRAEVQARIGSSPELSALYERERRVVERLHEARASDRAPARLRARIEAERPSRRRLAGRRATYGAALAGALAAVVLAVVLVLPGGTPGSPSLSQAAALAARGMAAPPPTPDPHVPAVKLHRDVEEVYFPNWSGPFGWRAVGQRVDHLNGRPAVTVYYQHDGQRLAYTIVGAPALSQPGAAVTRLNGIELRTLNLGGRLVVTWRRAGHTCVLSGTGVAASDVQRLAAWEAPGLERAAAARDSSAA